MQRPLAVTPADIQFTELGDGGLVLVKLTAGGSGAALYSMANPPVNFTIKPSSGCPVDFNFWRFPRRVDSSNGAPVALRACNIQSDGRVAQKQRFAWNASVGTFELLDGSGRCLSIASCDGANGDRVTLAPCSNKPPTPVPDNIGCDTTGPLPCITNAQQWSVTGSGGTPPNAIKSAISGRCIDVNGANNPDVIDLWDCGNGAYANEQFIWNATSGGIVTLDTYPECGCFGFCITPTD